MQNWIPEAVLAVLTSLPFRIAFLVVLAVIIRAIIVRAVTTAFRRAADARPRFPSAMSDERREQRMRALGSMMRSIISAVIFVILAAMILAELGFNITGLLTGTTIVAATIAFGMQNVIKDIVAGITILVEDQLGVGDYVDLEEASGTVVQVGLRNTTLRDDNGNLWYVRNGEVLRVGNFSQGGTGRPVVEPQPVQRVRLLDEPDPRD